MFLGKMTFEFDTNDRYLLKLAAELLREQAGALVDTEEQEAWAKQRAEYFIRLFTER
jgi:hypothetical protein